MLGLSTHRAPRREEMGGLGDLMWSWLCRVLHFIFSLFSTPPAVTVAVMSSFNALPEELVAKIMYDCDMASIFRLMGVSRKLRRLAYSPTVHPWFTMSVSTLCVKTGPSGLQIM